MRSSRQGLSMIIVDYLQLMTGPGARRPDNRQQEVAEISPVAEAPREGASDPGRGALPAEPQPGGARRQAAAAVGPARVRRDRAGLRRRHVHPPRRRRSGTQARGRADHREAPERAHGQGHAALRALPHAVPQRRATAQPSERAPGLPNATRRRVRAIHDRLAKRFGPLAAAARRRSARRAGAHRAVPAHQRPERRARVRRRCGRRSRPGRTWSAAPAPRASPTRSAAAASPTRRRRASRRSCARSASARARTTLDRLRDMTDAEAPRLPDVAAGHRAEDGRGRPQLRPRPRRDPRRHARAPGHAPARHGAREGLGRTSRPAAARTRPRRAADAAARRADPAGPRDLQGARPAVPRVPAAGPLPDRAALPRAGQEAGDIALSPQDVSASTWWTEDP